MVSSVFYVWQKLFGTSQKKALWTYTTHNIEGELYVHVLHVMMTTFRNMIFQLCKDKPSSVSSCNLMMTSASLMVFLSVQNVTQTTLVIDSTGLR